MNKILATVVISIVLLIGAFYGGRHSKKCADYTKLLRAAELSYRKAQQYRNRADSVQAIYDSLKVRNDSLIQGYEIRYIERDNLHRINSVNELDSIYATDSEIPTYRR